MNEDNNGSLPAFGGRILRGDTVSWRGPKGRRIWGVVENVYAAPAAADDYAIVQVDGIPYRLSKAQMPGLVVERRYR